MGGGPGIDLTDERQPAQLGGEAASAEASVPATVGDDALLGALLERGKSKWKVLDLDPEQENLLVERITRDFNDGQAATTQFQRNAVELVKNWEGIVDQKNFPYEDAANIRVPFTSAQVQQHAARIVKALLGGEYICKFEPLDETLKQEDVDEINQWFRWELEEVVKFHANLERIIAQTLIFGPSLPVAYWCKERRQTIEFREFTYDPRVSLQVTLQTAVEKIFEGSQSDITSSPGNGIYNLQVHDPDEERPDKAKVTFAISPAGRLKAKVEKTETVFNGVKVEVPAIEDMNFINTHPDIERLPFIGLRLWEDMAALREGVLNGKWRDLGEDRMQRIIATATAKVPQIMPIYYSDLQDTEEGTDSKDTQSVDYERRFIEIYRWEGNVNPSYVSINAQSIATQVLEPAVGVCAWTVPMAKELLKICRLEELNKDGERSPIKFGFIERLNRFLPISLNEWLRHVQAELDGIHNLRLDSATLLVMPFGFYKPLAGAARDVIDIKPGKLFPTADPASVNFPRPNGNPTWSYNDEALVKRYGGEQSGLGDPQVGSFISKRQSASEFMGTANAVDLRTEQIVNGYMRSTRKLLYRIFGLYQQFAPPTRIFQVGGEGSLRVVKRFETDRLHGKLLLRLTGSLDQINPQLQRDVAVNMLSILSNQILIQLGIVKPRTFYEAVQKIAKTMNYEGVKLYKPDLPDDAMDPNVENRMMQMGEDVEPNMAENFNTHLMAHQRFLVDENVQKMMTPSLAQRVLVHIQKTQKMMQYAAALRQMESLQAVSMAKNMAAMGVRPGLAGGQQPGDNAQPGTQEEGVPTGQSEGA